MINYIKKAGLIFIIMTVITGVIYPLAITAFAQVFVSDKANGSIITDKDNKEVGSKIIGQSFTDPGNFWSRPSAAGEGYDGYMSAGTNKTPTGKEYENILNDRIELLRKYDPENTQKVPIDLITTSGSGLDPHISVSAAEYQVSRISKYTNIEEGTILKLIEKNADKPFMGIFGESKVNVLLLNIELDKLK